MYKQIKSADGTEIVLLGKVSAAVTTARLGQWAQHAVCADTDSEIFFPAHDDPGTEAKQICRRCPVRRECLAFAITNDERFGIWGGLDPDERRNLRRSLQRRKAPAAAADRRGVA
ncbi:MAG TPA: WhiB family transcriptional regulator [Streptosporangiaceae bacterium]|nr:WhiB family transcriptional regulator [Streptosporangiaceae bacterium]